MKLLKRELSRILGEKVVNIRIYKKGNINKGYKVKTEDKLFLFRISHDYLSKNLYWTEASAYMEIQETKTIKTPEIVFVGSHNNRVLIILEYIQPSKPTSNSFRDIAHSLAQLHSVQKEKAGWKMDNFICGLEQINNFDDSWSNFFLHKRLFFQLEMALNANLLSVKEIPIFEVIESFVYSNLFNAQPVILHGNLWSHNVQFASNGNPYFYNPAISYGHHEVDIAMTDLFNKFNHIFYDTYFDIIPKENGFEVRKDIYQLYFLLVHLNLFGLPYKQRVMQFFKRYFN